MNSDPGWTFYMAAPSRWERFKAWLDTKLTRLRYRLQGCRCYYENNAINMKFSSWGCPKHKQAEGANYWYMSHEGGYAGSGKEPSYFWPESKHQDTKDPCPYGQPGCPGGALCTCGLPKPQGKSGS